MTKISDCWTANGQLAFPAAKWLCTGLFGVRIPRDCYHVLTIAFDRDCVPISPTGSKSSWAKQVTFHTPKKGRPRSSRGRP